MTHLKREIAIWVQPYENMGFPGATSSLKKKKNPANAGDTGDMGSIPCSGRYSRGGHGNSLQYSGLENPVEEGARRATVHGVAQNQKQLKRLSTHACMKTQVTKHRLFRFFKRNKKNMLCEFSCFFFFNAGYLTKK